MFVFGFLWWSIRWSFALVVFVAVMAGAGYYVFTRAVAGGGYVTVPNIVNMPMAKATYVIQDQGLVIGRQVAMPSDRVPPYHVISQVPPAGKVVRMGRKVYPTVSKGPDFEVAPRLVGELQVVAAKIIQDNGFRLGGIAYIPHEEPMDTVIAQDPPPGHDIASGGSIFLLVSAPASKAKHYMPDLTGQSLQEVMELLAPLGVEAVPLRVDRPDAPFDVVFEQQPEPGALVSPGSRVSFKIRATETVPGLWREQYVEYKVPDWRDPGEIRIILSERDGAPRVLFPRPQDYVNERPPKLREVRLPLRMKEEAEVEAFVEVYLDGVLVRTYRFRGGQEPVVTDLAVFDGGRSRAETEDSAFDPFL